MKTEINARKVALEALLEINSEGAYSNITLKKIFKKYPELSQLNKAFVTEIVNGTLKFQIQIDYIIAQFSSVKIKKITPAILNILRMGVYQIKFMNKVPVSAACNESVKLAKKFGHAGTVKFTNGLLRNISRNIDQIKWPDKNKVTERIAVQTAHPSWLVQLWRNYYADDFVEALCSANNQPPGVTLRINTLKTTKEALFNRLENIGAEYREGYLSDEAVIVRGLSDLSNWSPYQNGDVQVQDESSMLVGDIAHPHPKDFIIDVCSAPGGKATHMAQRMKDHGKILARDIHPHKLPLISENAARLGFHSITTEQFDATKLDVNLVEKADCVLIDAPCSGLGIIRKKPDIKLKKECEELEALIQIQREILMTCSQYVKPEGVLIYSTCTIHSKENLEQVEWFINQCSFELESIEEFVPKSLKAEPTVKKGYIQLYPHLHHCDGFFIARLKKKTEDKKG